MAAFADLVQHTPGRDRRIANQIRCRPTEGHSDALGWKELRGEADATDQSQRQLRVKGVDKRRERGSAGEPLRPSRTAVPRTPRGPAVHRTACVGEGQGQTQDDGGRRSAVGARVPPHAGGHRGQSAPSTSANVHGRARERPTAPFKGAKGPPLRCSTNFGRFHTPDKRTPPAGANCTLRRRLAVSSRRAVCSSAASGLRRVGPPLPSGC